MPRDSNRTRACAPRLLLVCGLICTSHGAGAGPTLTFGDCLDSGGRLLAGTGPQAEGMVSIVDSLTAGPLFDFAPYPGFQGGVRVATGDVNGDTHLDIITAAGPGGGPHVRVFNGNDPGHELASFFAFSPQFTGGVFVAAGDVNGDGFDDIIVGADAGSGPRVRAFAGPRILVGPDQQPTEELFSFFAYDQNFTGGVRVAAGDVTGDGVPDIITAPGPGGGPHVKVFDGLTAQEAGSFFAYPSGFNGGLWVGSGDFNEDDTDDVIVGAGAAPGPGGGPHIKVFDGVNPSQTIHQFDAFDAAWPGGVRVGSNDANGDGIDDIVVAPGPGMPSVLQAYSGRDLEVLQGFFPFGTAFNGGIHVAGGGSGDRLFCGKFE